MNLTDLMKSIVDSNISEEKTDTVESKEEVSILDTYAFLTKDVEKIKPLINMDDNLLLASFLEKINLSIRDIYILNYLLHSDRHDSNDFFNVNELKLEEEYLGMPSEIYLKLSELVGENYYQTSDIKNYLRNEVNNLNTFISKSETGKRMQQITVSRIIDSHTFKPNNEEHKNIFI